MLWSIVSKAAERSNNVSSTSFPESFETARNGVTYAVLKQFEKLPSLNE